jgi:hypothetical protein
MREAGYFRSGSPMTYLTPYFDYDVFVSYSHGDPLKKGDSPLKRWTQTLIEKLAGEITSLEPEFMDLHIWSDKDIDPTAHLTPELRASCILMIIMSKHYLASSWCKDEEKWFREQIDDRKNEPGRVFVIQAQETEESDWPEFLRDERGHGMPGFPFFNSSDKVPLGWPDLFERNEPFSRQLGTLRTALAKRLRELKKHAENRAAATAPAPAPAPARSQPRIYLHANPRYAAARANLKAILEKDGVMPLTAASDHGSDMAAMQRESRWRFETAKSCEALALFRADGDESFIGDLLQVGVDERERIETARHKPLPCAVLDRSGESLPIDVSPFRIERFDLTHDNWSGEFHAWLNRVHEQEGVAAP